jgi:hypothetical protein
MAEPRPRIVAAESHSYRVLETLGSGLQGKVKRGVCVETEKVRRRCRRRVPLV